jgi:hypothetical protein
VPRRLVDLPAAEMGVHRVLDEAAAFLVEGLEPSGSRSDGVFGDEAVDGPRDDRVEQSDGRAAIATRRRSRATVY